MRRTPRNDEHVAFVQRDRGASFGAGSEPFSGAGAAWLLRGSAQHVFGCALKDLEDVVTVLVVLELFPVFLLFHGYNDGEWRGL